MDRGWHKIAGILAGLSALALPVSASATTADISGTSLLVAGEDGERNDFVVAYVFDGSYKYLITEQAPGVPLTTDSAGCAPYGGGSPPQVVCEAAGIISIEADAGDKGDKVGTNAAIPTSIDVLVVGGKGADALTGGQAGERLRGGRGDDVIDAGGLIMDDPGDILIGGKGRDSLYGSYGPDLLKARDGERDKVLDCGEQEDPKPIRDNQLDPQPVNCENA